MTPAVVNFDLMTVPEIQELIAQIEAAALLIPEDQKIELPLQHYFSDGVYAREMNVPAGMCIVGKIHKKQNMHILSKGTVLIFSIDGKQKLTAPATWVASPGSKRLIYIVEDATWTTIHGTHETDLEKIEDEFIAKSYDDLLINEVNL